MVFSFSVEAGANVLGFLYRGDPMQGSLQTVFSWKAFATFVYKQTGYKAPQTAHPVLDAVARELLTGSLMRRNRKGHPTKPWSGPLDLRRSFFDPVEVNQLTIMKQWRLVWTPAPLTKRPKTPTVAQQLKRLGWKATLQIEATRIWQEQKSLGVKPVLSRIAEQLYQFALKHQIQGDRGRVPTAEYIRNHVISPKAWTRPL